MLGHQKKRSDSLFFLDVFLDVLLDVYENDQHVSDLVQMLYFAMNFRDRIGYASKAFESSLPKTLGATESLVSLARSIFHPTWSNLSIVTSTRCLNTSDKTTKIKHLPSETRAVVCIFP